MDGITFRADKKFDLQLSQALIEERQLAAIFAGMKIERIELKGETVLWERTGNICIEFRHNEQPSGIAATEADCWVHQLKRLGPDEQLSTLLYLMFPIERLKVLARAAIKDGRVRKGVGDDGLSDVALVRLRDVLR